MFVGSSRPGRLSNSLPSPHLPSLPSSLSPPLLSLPFPYLPPSPHTGEEVAKVDTLDGQWRAAQDKLKHKKRDVQQMEADMQVRVGTGFPLRAAPSLPGNLFQLCLDLSFFRPYKSSHNTDCLPNTLKCGPCSCLPPLRPWVGPCRH